MASNRPAARRLLARIPSTILLASVLAACTAHEEPEPPTADEAVLRGDGFRDAGLDPDAPPRVRIDPVRLTSPTFNVDYGPPLSTAQALSLPLTPGQHLMCAPTNSSCFLFQVSAEGTVGYDESLDGVVQGRGSDVLTLSGAPITLDLTAIDSPFMNINYGNLGGNLPNQVTPMRLMPGSYTLCASPSWDCVAFDVKNDGTLDYDASLDGILAGRGSQTLVAPGSRITIDATALEASAFNINYGAIGSGTETNRVTSFDLLPGRYLFCASPSWNCVDFHVQADGTLDYDASLDGALSGRGTRTLVVTGRRISIDASALSARAFNINYGAIGNGEFPNRPTSVDLLPGRYLFCASPSWDCVDFHVRADGSLDYDASLDGALLGRGTRQLRVVGRRISIDPTELDAAAFNINYGAIGGGTYDNEARSFNLLPGRYLFCANPSWICVDFHVRANGTLDYDASLDGALYGRGTRHLIVVGRTISLDASALDAGSFNLNYGTIGGDYRTDEVVSLDLLPGRYLFCASPSSNCVDVHVRPDGTVDYDASLDGALAGRGTSDLVVTGRRISIDATALDAGFFNLNYGAIGGDLRTDQVTDLDLVPGRYLFCASPSADCVDVHVRPDGTLDYDASLDGALAGRGTSALVVAGRRISIDATALDAGFFNLNYGVIGGDLRTDQVTELDLVPGRYLFCANPSSVCVELQVHPDGTLDYDASLDGVLTGRGTRSLRVTGVAITIDATAVASPDFNLNYGAIGDGTLPNQVTAFAVLPGSYLLCAPASSRCVRFDVRASGTVDYASSLDGAIEGRGTSRLTARSIP